MFYRYNLVNEVNINSSSPEKVEKDTSIKEINRKDDLWNGDDIEDGVDADAPLGTGDDYCGVTVIDKTLNILGVDYLIGTDCDDLFLTLGNENIVITYGGDDFVVGYHNNDTIYANFDGNKQVDDFGGNDIITTGSGNDNVQVKGDGTDEITTNAGDDFIQVNVGTNVDNPGDKYISAGEGNDEALIVSGSHENISIEAHMGSGDDYISVVGAGNMELYGDEGNDTFDFTLSSGVQNGNSMQAFGGEGDDLFIFNNGFTESTLGSGNDVIDYTQGGGSGWFGFNIDTVTDFTIGEDLIKIRQDALDRHTDVLDIDFSGSDASAVAQIMDLTSQLPFSGGEPQFIVQDGNNLVINLDYSSGSNSDLVLQNTDFNDFMSALNSGVDIFDFVA